MPGKNKLEQLARQLPNQEAAFFAELLQHPAFTLFIRPYLEKFTSGHSLWSQERSESEKKRYGFPQQDFIRGHYRFIDILNWYCYCTDIEPQMSNPSSCFFNLDLESRMQGKNIFYNLEKASLLFELHTQSIAYIGQLPFARESTLLKKISQQSLKSLFSPRMLAARDLIDTSVFSQPRNQLFLSPDGQVWLVIDVLSYLQQHQFTEGYVNDVTVKKVMKLREKAFDSEYSLDSEKVAIRYRRLGNVPMLLLINERLSERPFGSRNDYSPKDLDDLEETITKAQAHGFTLNDNKLITKEDVINGVLMHFPGEIAFQNT